MHPPFTSTCRDICKQDFRLSSGACEMMSPCQFRICVLKPILRDSSSFHQRWNGQRGSVVLLQEEADRPLTDPTD